MRRLSGVAVATLTILLAGCSAADGPNASPTPPGVPAAFPHPTAASGQVGDMVAIGPVTAVVEAAAAWPQEEQTLGPDVRGLSVLVRLRSSTPGLSLEAADFQLVEAASGARYAAGARPASRDLRFPLVLGATEVEGILSFTPPRTGTYSLRIAVNPDASGMIELGRIRTGIPSAGMMVEPSPDASPASSSDPTAAAATPSVGVSDSAGCIRITGGRWNPVGDDNKAPSLNREYVLIESACAGDTAMGGWTLNDKWRQNVFTFPADFSLPAGGVVRVYSGRGTPTASRLYFGRTSKEVWANQAPEMAYLQDASGAAVDSFTPY